MSPLTSYFRSATRMKGSYSLALLLPPLNRFAMQKSCNCISTGLVLLSKCPHSESFYFSKLLSHPALEFRG